MSTYPHTRRRVRGETVFGVVASTGTLALLWVFRPRLAELPRSLDEPLTATSLEEVGLLLGWVALALLALAILAQGLRSIARPRTGFVRTREWLSRRPSGIERSPERAPAHRTTSLASTPRSSGFPDQVVLTVPAPIEIPAATTTDSRVEATHEPPPISVSVLGPLQITGGRRRRQLRASAQELITYLALHPEGASRDQLLEALWPGEDPKRSEQRLWQSTSDARRGLGEVILRDRDRYRLERSAVAVDVEQLEGLMRDASTDSGDRRRELLEKAVGLYRGEPLADCDFAWCEGEIRRLRATYVELLEQVARARLEAGDARGALDAAERGLQVDLLNEAIWRLAMKAESELGLREAVEQRYETLQKTLSERIGLDPDRETRALFRELLAQR